MDEYDLAGRLDIFLKDHRMHAFPSWQVRQYIGLARNGASSCCFSAGDGEVHVLLSHVCTPCLVYLDFVNGSKCWLAEDDKIVLEAFRAAHDWEIGPTIISDSKSSYDEEEDNDEEEV